MRQLFLGFLCIVAILSGQSVIHALPSEQINSDDIQTFLQQANESQIRLHDEYRSKKEIESLLAPYFTNDYTKQFMEYHTFEFEEGWIALGTDMMALYVPNFNFEENTMVKQTEDQILIYHFVPARSDGPTTWLDHYEGLIIKKLEDGLRIAEYVISEDEPQI
ncbi:DUF3993 domain-containing protein [Bacillus solimangrovi]|uniref:DUF3993 domain-containing protein n=1 Tax=Bacillus solimangrovi TaxID=1305675 RepID=A0A1E5LJF5_9BACI|nr:DUF3993 domain-containing protein [Bacillus solimangrovi]OEH94229.1 hypothetical protein BFG57_09270 [Bacillus solimangrovi]